MTTQTLTPVSLVKNGGGLNLSALLAAPTGTTLQFANSGREILLAQSSASGVTVQVNVGATVLGQQVPAFTAVTLISGAMWEFGPFDAAADAQGGLVTVTLSATANVTVALVRDPGAS